MDTDILPSDNA